MVALLNIVAGLGWEPEIRGLLTVALSLAVLGGSIWLLLVTNTGTRLGSLIALAGFFGWMFIMGVFWWIYGIGWAGDAPRWEVQDVFIDPAGAEIEGLGDAFIGNVADLPDGNCQPGVDSFPPTGGVATVRVTSDLAALCTPRAIELVMVYPGAAREIVIQELLNPQDDESKIAAVVADLFGVTGGEDITLVEQLTANQRDQVFDELVTRRHAEIAQSVTAANDRLAGDPRQLDAASGDLDAAIAESVARSNLRIDDMSLSVLQGNAPEINEWAAEQGLVDFEGWNLQSTSQAGEAGATADAFLREELFPDGNFVVLDAFQQGGKPTRDGSDMWSRISHKITSTARIKHPTNYTVVNIQQALEKEADPAKAPPIAEVDPGEPTYSVVMTRNLGNVRLIPALFTLSTLALFLVTCLVLHWRDLALREKGLDV